MERAMKIQEVLLRAIAGKVTWWQAAEILGFSDRHVRRIRERFEEFGYESLCDRRRGRPSPRRVPVAKVEKVLGLYREGEPISAREAWWRECHTLSRVLCDFRVG